MAKFIFFGQLLGGHAFLLCADLEGNVESKQNRELAFVEHGARCSTFVILTSGASAGIRETYLAIVSVATFLAYILVTFPLDA